MRRVAISLCMVILLSGGAHSIEAARVIRIDEVEYRIARDAGDIRREENLAEFHELFITAAREVFARFEIRRPGSFRVSIARGAWLFRDITGMDRYTPAVFSPERMEFFFQNPEALTRRGIVSAVVYHEMLHCALHAARLERGCEAKAHASAWIEESLCAALYPVSRPDSITAVKEKPRSMQELQLRLEKDLGSRRRETRAAAYALARVWGLHCIKSLGERRLFDIAACGDTKGELTGAFRSF